MPTRDESDTFDLGEGFSFKDLAIFKLSCSPVYMREDGVTPFRRFHEVLVPLWKEQEEKEIDMGATAAAVGEWAEKQSTAQLEMTREIRELRLELVARDNRGEGLMEEIRALRNALTAGAGWGPRQALTALSNAVRRLQRHQPERFLRSGDHCKARLRQKTKSLSRASTCPTRRQTGQCDLSLRLKTWVG
jgi:hypothetical protein